MNRIEFDSIWWKDTWYEFGSYPETTYCILSVFPIGIIHRSAVMAMQQPSTSRTIFCVVGSFASSLSRHLAYRAVVANIGLRPPLFVLKRHSRGTLWYDQLQRSRAVSAAVAPVATH